MVCQTRVVFWGHPVENQRANVSFWRKVKHEDFIPESIVSNIIESFSDVKNRSHYMFSSVKTFRNGLGKPEEMIISRLSLSETRLILIYETYVF